MQIIFSFKLFYSSAYLFTQGLYKEEINIFIKNRFLLNCLYYINLLLKMHIHACIFFSEIHIVLHYKYRYILLKNQRTDSLGVKRIINLGYKIHMMCNETHEEQIQYSYAAT